MDLPNDVNPTNPYIGVKQYKNFYKIFLQERFIMTEQEFHNQRKAFAIIDGKLTWCPKGLSHKEWLVDTGIMSQYVFDNELVRGYMDDTDIYFYQGDFKTNDYVELVARSWLCKFDQTLPVYCGVIKGKVGERWRPVKRIR